MKAGFSAASAAVAASHSPYWLHCIGLLSTTGLISKPNAAFKKCISPMFPLSFSLFATVLSRLSTFTSHLFPLPLRAVCNLIFIVLFFPLHMTPSADFSLLFSFISCQNTSHLCLFKSTDPYHWFYNRITGFNASRCAKKRVYSCNENHVGCQNKWWIKCCWGISFSPVQTRLQMRALNLNWILFL